MCIRRSTASALFIMFVLVISSAAGPAAAQSARSTAGDREVPRVPRFPIGRLADGIPEWERLNPACKGTRLRDVRPCMQSFVDYGSMLGAVTLVDRRGLPLELSAVGTFDPNTIVQIQSMTKPFVSILILKLVEEGKIPSVDSRVRELAGFENFPHPEVTVRQLLTHTSGMWYRKEIQPGVRIGIAPHLTNRLEKQPTTTVRDKPLRFVAEHYANPELYPLEAAGPQYSNIGFTMLGWIIERLSGQTLDQYMKHVILEPLDLTNTFFFPSAATREQQTRIADLDRRLPDPSDYDHYDKMRPGWVYVSPEGGLYSTAEDLRRFLLLFRHGGEVPGRPRVLTEASIALLMQDEPGAAHGCNDGLRRSLGFYVIGPQGCHEQPGFSPGTIWHAGRFSTEFWYDPQKDEIGMFLAQVVMENPVYTASVAERDAFKQLLAGITTP